MGWDWEASSHIFYGCQLVRVGGETMNEATEWLDEPQEWLRSVVIGDGAFDTLQRRVLGADLRPARAGGAVVGVPKEAPEDCVPVPQQVRTRRRVPARDPIIHELES